MCIRSRLLIALGPALLAASGLCVAPSAVMAKIEVGGDVRPAYPAEAPFTWSIIGSLFVGYAGSGTVTLKVQDLLDVPGSIQTTTAGYIGYLATGTGDMTVKGEGTSFFTPGTLAVGHLGEGHLTIEDGGVVRNGVGRVGVELDSKGDATVRGTNARWLGSSTYEIGVAGEGAVSIENGGYIRSVNVVYFGYFGAGNGTGTVQGESSTWFVDGDMRVGYLGTGALTIRSGGLVHDREGQVAATSGSLGTAQVTGVDSRWENETNLRIGPSGLGQLTIEDGGVVTVGALLAIGPVDTLKLRDGGTLSVATFAKPSANGAMHGQFLWEGGRLEANSIPWSLINDHGVLAPGTSTTAITSANDYSQGAGGTLEIGIGGPTAGTQYDRLAVSDSLRLDGTLRVVLLDSYVPSDGQVFDILNWHFRVGRFEALDLPDLAGTLRWNTSQLYVDGTLSVISDRDGDGLADTWEGAGNGVPISGGGLYALAGSDPDHKDLYVEIDAMDELVPMAQALADVIAAFAAVPNAELSPANPDGADGITLHIHMDELELATVAWSADGWPDFDGVKTLHFGNVAEQLDFDVLRAKAEAYRYCVFADRLGNTGDSGLSEISGNDLMVTLGDFHPRGGTRQDQAGTFMHELGHTLGLRHGGDDNLNYKPNYFSVMNYTWQFPITFYAGSWELDYSHAPALASLDETALDEASGLPGPAGRRVPVGPPIPLTGVGKLERVGANVDFNRNGNASDGSAIADINHVSVYDQASPGETALTGFADWPKLAYLPSNNPQWNSAGNRTRTASNELTVQIKNALDTIGDCNGNGVSDDEDLSSGTSQDANGNGIPDECDQPLSVPGAEPGQRLTVLPNPALGGRTTVHFQLATGGFAEVAIYDVGGRRVVTLATGVSAPGSHTARWDGRDSSGRAVAAGIYFARLRAQHVNRIVRFVVIR